MPPGRGTAPRAGALQSRACHWALRIVIASCVLFTRQGSAQIVNVQPLITDPNRPGLGVVLDSSLDLRTGNTQLFLLSGSGLVRYRYGRQLVFVLARQDYGVQGGQRFVSKDFEHLRYRFSLAAPLELEYFLQHDRDQFRRVASRLVWGMGPRFRLLFREGIELALGAAYMQELQRLDHASEPDAGELESAQRLSTYGALTVQVDERVHVAQTVYAQPRFDRPEDIRVLNESELLVSLGEAAALKASLSLEYDSFPPDGRHTLDTVTKTGLQVRLK
jgi:hypothetical protein